METLARFGSPLTEELAHGVRLLDAAPTEPAASTMPTPAIRTRVALHGADGASVEVGANPVVIGRPSRAGGPDLAVADATVSRRQVAVWRADGATLARDLGSRNGTLRRRDADLHPVTNAAGAATLLIDGDELLTVDGALLAAVVEGS